VHYLGHVVGRHGLKVDPVKIQAVAAWPTPKDVHKIRHFLGLTKYFREFIQGYAEIAAPLEVLINKGNSLHWGERQARAFQRLKDALCTAPVFIIPDLNKPFTVISDASLQGTGAVLLQEDRPCAYRSRKFNPAERNYHTIDQELLGVVRALSEWRYYLKGSDCTLQTDHNVLIHLQTQPTQQAPNPMVRVLNLL
jgi:hypothetical protein